MDQQVMKNLFPMQRGISMIEVMATIAVLAVVMAIGAPNLSSWMHNTEIKSTAQNVLTGLQLARGEAVRRNARVSFTLTDASGTTSWSVGCVTVSATCEAPIQTGTATEGGQNARLGVSTASLSGTNYAAPIAAGSGMSGAPSVVFTAFGQAEPTATNITRIDVTNSADANARRMVIRIPAGGSASLCDPAATNSQSC
ncbi:MAG TPA: hypothetical protein DHV67_08070 [Gallionella sp.]|nr:MAG: hypothetical protein CO070_06045 [Gallionellales bacterium CG_4_9_14_0_8_um_filter_55_61]HCJ51788.1 hypothetical protein [Gallionella sp.]